MSLRAIVIAGFLAAAFVARAWAGDFLMYNGADFKDRLEAKKPILVEIDASWCPICAKQRPIIGKLSDSAEFKDLIVMVVNFDKQKDAVRGFNATQQSTLIVFRDGKEVGRSVGETDPGAIKALLEKTNG